MDGSIYISYIVKCEFLYCITSKGGLGEVKVIIQKFGPIKKFEYDLDKEMIVTYGNNNIG